MKEITVTIDGLVVKWHLNEISNEQVWKIVHILEKAAQEAREKSK